MSNGIDTLVSKHTAFKTLGSLVSESVHGYRPTLDCANPEVAQIADAYDAAMASMGKSIRSYRYESPSTVRQMKNLRRRHARKAVVQVGEG